MGTTTQLTITKTWQKISDSDCTVQSVYSAEQFQFANNATIPTTTASLLIRINEPVNLAYKSPIWCKLPDSATKNELINVIK